MPYDIVIRNGIVVDGSGQPGFPADVAIEAGRIVEIGHVDGTGRREIDAEGHVVTPGFIDGHTHMDAQINWDPLGTCSCWHGVTTVVMGNCGFTLAPAKPDRRELVVRNLERAEDISAKAMAEGIDWTWETFPEYLSVVDRLPKGINYAGYVGHSALRTWAMGERAFTDTATDADLEAMKAAVTEAMEAGAMGFTTSRSDAHQTSDGRPVASRAATWDEVRTLVRTMGAAGGGLFELALEPAYASQDAAERAEFLGRLHDLALEPGVTVTFGVIATSHNTWRDLLACLDRVHADGGRMFGQSHSRPISVLLSFETRLPFDALPEWEAVRSLPLAEQRTALEDEPLRRKLIDAAEQGHYAEATGVEVPRPDYDHLRVLRNALPPHASVAELAAEQGTGPVETMVNLAREAGLRQFFMQEIHNREPDDILTIMKHPQTVMTFSDSGAHVSQIMDSSIQTHLLAHWVRDKQAFSLEEAVHMLTQVPASVWGFADRGTLAPGFAADINVFDPERVAPELPTVETDLPGGAKRLKQRSTGFLATIVNGEVLFSDGEHTGAFPGRLLRRGRSA
jgi:N-acyl-D-amino-acid deacylase